MKTVRVTNTTRGTPLGERIELADGIWSRFWGLMGRRRLEPGSGMLISPCSSVHTAFMRFPIDVIFIDGEGKVLRVVPGLRPFRVAIVLRGARQVLELPAGTAQQAGLEPGDRLTIAPAGPERSP